MKRYWDQIEIGDAVPKVSRSPITRLQIAQFAAASDDFSPMNLDDEQAKAAGYNSVFAPGLMALGFAEETLKMFASNMKVLSLTGTFQRLIWPGDVLEIKGLVLRRYQKNSEHRIQMNIWCENQLKEVVMRGTCIGLLFKNAQHEEKSQTKTPAISTATHDALLKRCAHLITPSPSKNVPHVSERKELV